jgi:hypothetical protein
MQCRSRIREKSASSDPNSHEFGYKGIGEMKEKLAGLSSALLAAAGAAPT